MNHFHFIINSLDLIILFDFFKGKMKKMTSSNEQRSSQETITNNATNLSSSREDPRQPTFTDHTSEHKNENVEGSNIDNSNSTSVVQEHEPSQNRRSSLSNKVAETVKVTF